MRTVEWNYDTDKFQMIDQRLLPSEFKIALYDDYRAVAQAISDMVVRGAPAIGVAAAFGLALAAQQSKAMDFGSMHNDLEKASNYLKQARPTAVNLAWALDRILKKTSLMKSDPDDIRKAVLTEAQKIADEDVKINKSMARFGAELISDGDTVIHHCNTGALAAVDWGTALGAIRMAHEEGKKIHVLLDETRPRLQGARLSAWELKQYGIPYDIICDNAAGYFLRSGQVQKCFVGSDRTATNGDVANKIGTYMLALAAYDNGVPFYPVVPTSTVDLALSTGVEIPIEERDPHEVLALTFQGNVAHPEGATARNPAFDVTPHRLVTAIVTENGVVYPPFVTNLPKAVRMIAYPRSNRILR
jgi:methylthioribose-1-phosphate isomerase